MGAAYDGASPRMRRYLVGAVRVIRESEAAAKEAEAVAARAAADDLKED